MSDERREALLKVIDHRASQAATNGQHETAEKWAAFGVHVEAGTLGDGTVNPDGATSRVARIVDAITKFLKRRTCSQRRTEQ